MYINVVACTNYPSLVAFENLAVIISQPLFFRYTLPSGPRRRCFQHIRRRLKKCHLRTLVLQIYVVQTPNCEDRGNLTPERAIIKVSIWLYNQYNSDIELQVIPYKPPTGLGADTRKSQSLMRRGLHPFPMLGPGEGEGSLGREEGGKMEGILPIKRIMIYRPGKEIEIE